MNSNNLNKMITYIENNLDNEIDYNQLSKITNTNIFIIDRIFVFLTGISITEYIKKRRLSKAFEEIRNTNEKVIDIAFKYQYNSAASFNRAFKKQFNVTPTECRKGIGNYKIKTIEYFEFNKKDYNFDYEIKKIDSEVLYCYHIKAKNHEDLIYKIKKLYQKIHENGDYQEFNKIGMYGIFYNNNDFYHYYLGSKKQLSSLEKFIIEEYVYSIFNLPSRKQNDIIDFEKKINKQWIPSTNYQIKNTIKIELYKNNQCYIYLPIQ